MSMPWPPHKFGPVVKVPQSKTHDHPVIGGEDHPDRDRGRLKKQVEKEAPVAAQAQLQNQEINLRLLFAPDTKDDRGNRFVPDNVVIMIYPDGSKWLGIRGRAIRKDGSVGTAKRYRGGDICLGARRRKFRSVPAWLLGVLASVPETEWAPEEYRANAPKVAQKVID